MGRKAPILNQAVADKSGFTLYSRPAREWSSLATLSGTIFALSSLALRGLLFAALTLVILAMVATVAAIWLRRTRFEFTLLVEERLVTIIDVVGLWPVKRCSFPTVDLARVEFGRCSRGRQRIRFVWRNPTVESIEAVVYGANCSEGDLARSLRTSLTSASIAIADWNSE